MFLQRAPALEVLRGRLVQAYAFFPFSEVTLDARHPASPGMYKTLKTMVDQLPISWCRISAMNSMILSNSSPTSYLMRGEISNRLDLKATVAFKHRLHVAHILFQHMRYLSTGWQDWTLVCYCRCNIFLCHQKNNWAAFKTFKVFHYTWSANMDPYNGLISSFYNWVVFHPKKKNKWPGALGHCSICLLKTLSRSFSASLFILLIRRGQVQPQQRLPDVFAKKGTPKNIGFQ